MRPHLFNVYATENIPSPLREYNTRTLPRGFRYTRKIGLYLSFELQILYCTLIHIIRPGQKADKYESNTLKKLLTNRTYTPMNSYIRARSLITSWTPKN